MYPSHSLVPHYIAGCQKRTNHRSSDLFSQHQAKVKMALKTKKRPSLGAFQHKITRKSHKTYIKSRIPERIWFSQEFCPAGFT